MAHKESSNAKNNRRGTLQSLLIDHRITSSTGPAWTAAYHLVRLASRHHSLAENACNRELTPREVKEEGNIEARITALVREWNPSIKVSFSGDPRGYTVHIHFPAKDGRVPCNSWGGSEAGWCI
jgi:hypothetical protein